MTDPGADGPKAARARDPPGRNDAGHEEQNKAGRDEPSPDAGPHKALDAAAHDEEPQRQPADDPLVPPSDGDVALAIAAQGFLVSRWLGALLMVYSFTHLYVFGLRPGASVAMALLIAGAFLVAGSLMWWRSRTYAHRLESAFAPRWEGAADLFAYTAIVFWLLFLLALWLLSRGVALF